MNQVVTFSSVETKKTGNSKRGPWALRLFTTAGGTKFQTFDVDLGESLEGHLNLPLEITYEIEDNGDFKNNVIKGWKPSENGATVSEPVQSTSNGETAEEKQLRIMRQSALDRAISSVAGGLVTDDNDVPLTSVDESTLFAIADRYVDYFVNGAA